MALKICIIALLLVAASANEKQQRYGGRPARPNRPVRPGGNFQGGILGGQLGNHGGGFQGAFPGGAGVGHQGGFQGGVGGIGHQGGFQGGVGGFPGGVGGIGHQGGFPGGVGGIGHQGGIGGGFPGGIGGGGFGPGIGNTGIGGGSGNLQYNCAATASQGQYGIDSTCQKWCKAPQQYWGGKYVCCDDRPAVCPPVRAQCPKFGGGQGPVCCFVDSQCQIPTDKCCHDTCLGHKVCKSAYKQGF